MLIKVLFAVLKNDIEVSLSDYSNSIYSRLSFSSSSAPSVMTGFTAIYCCIWSSACTSPLIDLFIRALDGRIELLFDTDPNPDVAV